MTTSLTLNPLGRLAPEASIVDDLYHSAFPIEERRPADQWWEMAARHPVFRLEGIYQDDRLVGFITSWPFPEFTYVEHFAIHPDNRGQGLGGIALDTFLCREGGRPVVLEIEPLTTPIACRRADFYARYGFSVSPRPYLQPPYHSDGEPFSLLLLSTDISFLETHFDEVVSQIHGEVYHWHGKHD